MVGKSQAPMFRGEKPLETKLAPGWSLERVAKHAIDFWLSTEDLPRPENRVTVDARRAAHARLQGDERRAEGEACTTKLKSLLGMLDLNPDHLVHRVRVPEERHPGRGLRAPGGHVRFGDDPATSVLNRDCRAHEVDNLYVVDTSFFP